MIMPPGHVRDGLIPYRWSKREKWIVGGVLSLVLALVVAVVISVATAGPSSGNGCVNVALPNTLGGGEIYRCGEAARGLCATAGRQGGVTGATGVLLAGECRKAGIAAG